MGRRCLTNADTLQEDEDSDSGKYQMTDVASSTNQVFSATHHDMSTYFKDGRRKIDFVMVYEENMEVGNSSHNRRASVLTPLPLHLMDKKLAKHDNWRQRFMSNLRKAGLEIEEVIILSYCSITHRVLCASTFKKTKGRHTFKLSVDLYRGSLKRAFNNAPDPLHAVTNGEK